MEKISVAIRVRPPTKPECQSAKGYKWRVGPHNVTLYSTLGTPVNGHSYSFDHVFGKETKNADVYHGLTKEVIMSTLSGFNGTVFAYGQTSSGKTYTMKGTSDDPGIIRLAVHDVFNKIQETSSREFLIRVSYMEIYNEEINDLFAPENRRLQIHENLEKGIFVAGLREEIVDSPEQVFHLLEFGESHRHFGETNMNLYSSRSHTIFRMVIESRDVSQDGFDVDGNSDAVRVSALNLVDLAGSERIAKTGAGGVRLKEGTHINKSLMTLGTVINKLSDGTGRQGGHIPYRDSKLTRILQPALGGNAITAMICTVTPDEIHIDETRGTLQFASRAKRVTNCAQVNETLTDAALLKRQTKEIEELRMKLQGLPQSEHLEKEILNLRNELLKYELVKERLYLELQEEKKAQVDRERRIKEQQQKIDNLSTLFMSSSVDDRDNEKQPKRVNRRETWCPRQLNSELGAEHSGLKLLGKNVEEEAMDSVLSSMRRDRRFDLPPAFDTLVDAEAWNDSTAIEDPLPPSDFENIADEDTWMSMNKGHTTSSTVFISNMFERGRSSGGTSEAEKLASIETELKNLQEKYDNLRNQFDVKLQESTKQLRAEVDYQKKQLEKVMLANGNLRTQLQMLLNENATLTHELSVQLESQRCLKRVIEDVECEMDAARLLTSSLQGILVDSLHVQAVTVQSIQGCFAATPYKGPRYKAQRFRDKRALVESSVQKCRDICADVHGAIQDRLAHMNVGSEGNLQYLEHDTEGNVEEAKFTCNVVETRDAQTQAVLGASSRESDPQTKSETVYCSGCSPSVLPAVNWLDHEQVSSFKEDNLMTCQCHFIAESHSRVMSVLRRSVCNTDHHCPTGLDGHIYESKTSNVPTRISSPTRAEQKLGNAEVNSPLEVDSSVSYHTDSQGQGLDCEEAKSFWKGLVSGPHVECSSGASGQTCGTCADHERVLMGKNQIPMAMSNLCGHILKLLRPFPAEDDSPSTRDVKDVPDLEDVQLKARLTSAKVLTAWLFEELHRILKHDLPYLKLHVKERSSVGLMLERLQVPLLENASLAVGLMQATCQDESVMNELISRLQGLKDVYNNLTTFEPESTKMEVKTDERNQTDTPIQIVQLAAPEQQAFSTVSGMDASVDTSSTEFPSRVLKLEGVEEMLGKLLQYSMGRLLNREHQVVEGITLLLVLTVGLQAPPIYSDDKLQLQLSLKKVEEARSTAESDQSSACMGANNVLPRQSSGDDQTGNCVALNSSSTHLSTEVEDEATAEEMQVIWGESGPSGMQPDITIFDNFFKAKTIQEFIWRTSDSNKRLREQLLIKMERVEELEYSLASSEIEAVELKVELEDIRARLQICEVSSQKGSEFQCEFELEALRNRCENYEEEIRLIMQQVPTPDDDFRRERQLVEIMEENVFLRNCLTKTNKRLSRKENRRTKSSRTTRIQEGDQTVKDEDLTASCSAVAFSGLPRDCAGVGRPSSPKHPGKSSGPLELLAEDEKHSALLNELEVLKRQVAEQERFFQEQAFQKPSYGAVCEVATPHNSFLQVKDDDADSTDILSTHSNKGNPRHLNSRSERPALGLLEINGRNAAARRNLKRRRRQMPDDSFSNKENLSIYR